MKMLQKALENISVENHSTILRRSAGIPPTIIAILRAEPAIIKANRAYNRKPGCEPRSEETELLNKTLEFLLAQVEQPAQREDTKIHALNIMKAIFSDALLRHDARTYISRAMILSMEEFQSDNWSIRNSALMCFTALIKRLLDDFHIQEQNLGKKRGFSICDLLTRYDGLLKYFTGKLAECKSGSGKLKKEEKDKQDLAIFSILLLTSRLVPFSWAHQDEEKLAQGNDFRAELFQRPEVREQLDTLVQLIKSYSDSGTYFVRKISAQALLPLLQFGSYIPEVTSCCKALVERAQQKDLR